MSNWIRRGNHCLRRSNATRRDWRALVMGILIVLLIVGVPLLLIYRCLTSEGISEAEIVADAYRTLDGTTTQEYGKETERQLKVLKNYKPPRGEYQIGWTGPNRDVPVIIKGAASDRWADKPLPTGKEIL